MRVLKSQNSQLGNERSVWRHFVVGIAALVTLTLVAVGLAVQSGPEVVVARGEFVPPSRVLDDSEAEAASAGVGELSDEVLGSAVVPRAKAVSSPGDVTSLGRIALPATATPAPTAASVPTVTPAPTATPVPTAVPATATPVPTAIPAATATPIPTAVPAATPTSVPAPPPIALAPVAPTPVPVAPTAVPVAPTLVPVVPTAVPVVAPVIQASTSARSGPPGVVNQIPGSAWRWLDAHNWKIEWRQGPGPARVSEAQYATNTIVIWYDTARSDTFWLGAFGHELGHAVSYVHFNTNQMNEWNAQRGFSSWRWVPGMPNDFLVGEGDFAEAFMGYLFGHQIRSAGGALTQAQRAWIAANTPF